MEENLKRREYQKFQLQWMIDHGFTLEDLIRELTVYAQDCELETPIDVIFEYWESDVGFDAEIYPCYDEWLLNEGAEFNE